MPPLAKSIAAAVSCAPIRAAPVAMTTRVWSPPFDAEARGALARAIASGAVMTYPTETSYALGGNALDAGLCGRIAALKGRPGDKALLLLIGGEAQAERCAREMHPGARVLMERFWPGPLTLVVLASPNLPGHLVDSRGTVALRWSPHPALRDLLELGGVPLIGTSANRSGGPPLLQSKQVIETFGDTVEVAVDAGPAPGGLPSTLVDTTVLPFRILRLGALHKTHIQAALIETCIDAAPD